LTQTWRPNLDPPGTSERSKGGKGGSNKVVKKAKSVSKVASAPQKVASAPQKVSSAPQKATKSAPKAKEKGKETEKKGRDKEKEKSEDDKDNEDDESNEEEEEEEEEEETLADFLDGIVTQKELGILAKEKIYTLKILRTCTAADLRQIFIPLGTAKNIVEKVENSRKGWILHFAMLFVVIIFSLFFFFFF